jgi:tRNA(Ile2) C34 agmatinyltransferase TiaS
MLENLLEYYRKSDGATKKKIPGCIFSEKPVLETRIRQLAETQFRAAEMEKLQVKSLKPEVRSLQPTCTTCTTCMTCTTNNNASEVLRNSKKKKEVENDLLSRLVPRTDKSCNHYNIL